MRDGSGARVALVLVMFEVASACRDDSAEALRGAQVQLTPAEAVLGFEEVTGWSVEGAQVAATPIRTEGESAFALGNPANHTVLVSAPLPSTAVALAGIADPGAQVLLDVSVPAQLGNPHNAGSLELVIRCPSRGVQRKNVGKLELDARPPDSYRTIRFGLPGDLRAQLAGGAFTDLVFELALQAPGKVSGTYRFDHLRVRADSTEPPGAGLSVDLTAIKVYSPPADSPGEAHFSVGAVQIPRAFHVRQGSAKGGSARLELGFGSTPVATCLYAGASTGASYDFQSCTSDVQSGDILSADFARLTILGGDQGAGPTKVRAQLAENPLGDEVGRGLLPPIPTFWGDSADESDQIINAYSGELNAGTRTRERFITFPVPEFANRHGDGAGRNLLDPQLPPPANDPPFDQEGHMNPGGQWDAYWRFQGGLSTPETEQRHTTQLDADLSAHVVVWGKDQTVLTLSAGVQTDNGLVFPDHFGASSVSGGVHLFLFKTNELPGGGDQTSSGGFNFHIAGARSFDAPAIHVWIFAVQVGLTAEAEMTVTGEVTRRGFQATATPTMAVGGHLFGGVDVGIASGGVDATVEFIHLSTPLEASATWHVSTSPEVCRGSLDFLLDGHALISTLGGKVDLVAKFGVCPFCDHERMNIFRWTGKELGDQALFHFSQKAQHFPLATSLCRQPLTVTIVNPKPGGTAQKGIPLTLSGSAERPPFADTDQTIVLPTPIDCSLLTWTSNQDGDEGFPGTCAPEVTFNSLGTHTVTLKATDSFGETGSATRDINVVEPPPGPVPSIVKPLDGEFFPTTGSTFPSIDLEGKSKNGTPPVTLTWTAVDSSGQQISIGDGALLTWQPPHDGTFTLTLTAVDSQSPPLSNTSDPVTITVAPLVK